MPAAHHHAHLVLNRLRRDLGTPPDDDPKSWGASLAECLEEGHQRKLNKIILGLAEHRAELFCHADDGISVGTDLDLFANRVELREQPVCDFGSQKGDISMTIVIEVVHV